MRPESLTRRGTRQHLVRHNSRSRAVAGCAADRTRRTRRLHRHMQPWHGRNAPRAPCRRSPAQHSMLDTGLITQASSVAAQQFAVRPEAAARTAAARVPPSRLGTHIPLRISRFQSADTWPKSTQTGNPVSSPSQWTTCQCWYRSRTARCLRLWGRGSSPAQQHACVTASCGRTCQRAHHTHTHTVVRGSRDARQYNMVGQRGPP